MTEPAHEDSAPARRPKTEITKNEDGKGDQSQTPAPKEIGGRSTGLNPTRYGDWEKKGRCIDF